MINYFKEIIDDFPEKMKVAKTSAATHLFEVNEESTKLGREKGEIFTSLSQKFYGDPSVFALTH